VKLTVVPAYHFAEEGCVEEESKTVVTVSIEKVLLSPIERIASAEYDWTKINSKSITIKIKR